MAALTNIFSGMEKAPEAIQGNFDSLNKDLTGGLNKLNQKIDLLQKDHITGYVKGFIGWARVGNLVIATFDVELGQIQVNWNIVSCPPGYRPSAASRVSHFSMVGDKELSFTDNGGDLRSMTDVPNGGWWVGACAYFTDDDFPA